MATKPRYMKTPLQLWIVDHRKRLGLTPGDLATMTGVTEDTARGWESRGQPSEEALAILQRRFGEPIPANRETPADQGALIAALDRQTKAIEALVAMMAPVVLSQGRRLDQIDAVLRTRFGPAMQDTEAHPAREPSAESSR
jgi:transcriptional regulator with XRE-family HTH domain